MISVTAVQNNLKVTYWLKYQLFQVEKIKILVQGFTF